MKNGNCHVLHACLQKPFIGGVKGDVTFFLIRDYRIRGDVTWVMVVVSAGQESYIEGIRPTTKGRRACQGWRPIPQENVTVEAVVASVRWRTFCSNTLHITMLRHHVAPPCWRTTKWYCGRRITLLHRIEMKYVTSMRAVTHNNLLEQLGEI
jgi:hypothetical protein